ncbi:MAG: DUF87 domain-containing protein [Selenomonas ruminantium]|nr:DUF87 domain-containing protein [Selenomonas ruminantium]
MKEEQKRILIKYGLLPFIILNALYYSVACLLCDWYFKTAKPGVMSLVKNVLSYLFQWLDINFIYVRYPIEIGVEAKIRLVDYHELFRLIPQGDVYAWYPIFVLISALICFVWSLVELHNTDTEGMYKDDSYLRGIKKISAKKFCKLSEKKTIDPLLSLPTDAGGLYLSASRMKEHCMILGSTGSGKSQLLLNIVDGVLRGKGTRLIIVDRKGEFYSYFGDGRRDVLFHPFDSRSVKWDLFNEIKVEIVDGRIPKMPSDIVVIADTLYGVANAKGEDKFWRGSASAIFQSAVCWCILNKKTTTLDLVKFLRSSAQEISTQFRMLPSSVNIGYGTLGNPNIATASSIMSFVQDGIRQLDIFASEYSKWSVRDWINNGNGNLFISTAGKNDETFTSIVSLIIDLVGREIKEFPDAKEKGVKICIVIDELGALPALSTLIFLLTQARSKGVSVIIANQTISKLKNTYGNNETENIIANCKSKFVFSLKEHNDAKYISEQIGASEVARKTHNRSENVGVGNGPNTVSEGSTIVQNVAFLSSEISSLEVGQAVVTLPQMSTEVAKVQFLQASIERKNQEYVPIATNEYKVDEVVDVLGRIPKKKKAEEAEKSTERTIERF